MGQAAPGGGYCAPGMELMSKAFARRHFIFGWQSKFGKESGATESVCELDSGSCSARLQAGISLIPECPPEGGRYKSGKILSFHTDSTAPAFLAPKCRGSTQRPTKTFLLLTFLNAR
jgi:hypothetical protein